ncbi:Branched-chain-amino-acid aminotransferase [Limihaloglobus sulfuriphilus]|uniref:Branched-chain-amino-acid aminotransferase n=1 Tax=Limihaloglobus sulfuriphilus TaxID=1851148 RepID=A0A1Q2MFI4_9BACT|nr:branched-chain-amino-acid transaminase [Limihaloglobus sulfuriphilus]AQQ71463.1 Branched-chain-amino-acid aminotransferase [Limihaloglobus sulfuriphilus]
MSLKIWINNKLVDEKDAVISVFDHGLLYGDGVFEGIRVYNGKIFKEQEHLVRLYESADAIRLQIALNIEEMSKAMNETVKANGIKQGYIRLIITRGIGTLGLDPFICKDASIIIIADNVQLYPKELYDKGLKVISSSVIRNHPMSLSPQIKSLNYLNNIMAKIEATDSGMLEAIMYNHEGYVAEATGDNIFIVKNGTIFTPPVSSGSLNGITRATVIELSDELGYDVVEQNLTRFDLYTADEVFLTGTAAEVIGIVEIDGRKIGDGAPGEITKELKDQFFKYASGE